eukprot:TRINITY_DN74460_c0_g1_i1.p1 TRINITY_DN74460_c0_g1~~TRINITY_DN74460_c0_g1_i1.p1  ORF type:complete len:659 (-),score=125.16 TRINITY_DN74460_c0_g1_i1:92-2068(-)
MASPPVATLLDPGDAPPTATRLPTMTVDADCQGWDDGTPVLCHGWLTKRRHQGDAWWERYFILHSGGLLGWYQQPPGDVEQPSLPRRWIYMSGAQVVRELHPASASDPGPIHRLVVSETVGESPALTFGSDEASVVEAWHRELLLARALPPGPRSSWSSRLGGVFPVVARYGAVAADHISGAGRAAGAFLESALLGAGTRAGIVAAQLLRLPDEDAAGRAGANIGQLLGAPVSFAAQAPGAALGIAARCAGGARRPTFVPFCRGRRAEPLADQAAPALMGQLLSCDGCGAAPVSDSGCSYCRLRFCTECFFAHTSPPVLMPPDSAREARQSEEQRAAVAAEEEEQRNRDLAEYERRVRQAREQLSARVAAPVALSALPEHWVSRGARPECGWSVSAVREPALLRGLQACLATNPAELGRGRDVVSAEPYSQLRLAAAWRVEHHLLWPRYCQALVELDQHRRCCDMPRIDLGNEAGFLDTAMADWSVALGCPLNNDCNEKLLAHGTKPENVAAMLATGMNERHCSGLFGLGSYLGEDIGKCDQYAVPDPGLGAYPELHDILYHRCRVPHPSETHYVFICRAALGRAARTKDGNTELSSGSSVWAGTEKRELAQIPGTSPPLPYHSLVAERGGLVVRYREFIIFHSERIYPEYLIAYKRC